MRLILSLILGLALALPASAQTLTVAADPWPPFINPDDDRGGVAIEIIREALSRSDYEIELEIVPWARAEAGVRAGDYDILPGTWYTEERAKELKYSEPYVTNELKFIQQDGEDFKYDGLTSLEGKTVAVVRDYGYDDAFNEADFFTREPAPDMMTNIRKLADGRVDLTIADELVARYTINEEAPKLLDKIDFVDPPFSSKELHMTVGRAHPEHETIVSAFNDGLEAMKSDGSYDQILEEYELK